ncbi:BQ5605_C004g03082 [Microbotryum silenes-dioicae]|uniref:BQ5605_C004g03082 protein n=1 Tax=Microbotryum silenes-dioicae TaxID=796604 RepID=A0A2X0MWT2_9BASI|nr:BQ5605_C004g03082 [Microbotryum silenes-dioicae]
MLKQGRISSSFGRFVQETALLQTPFNILLQYILGEYTHLLVPDVAIRISTCRVQTRDLNSSGELSHPSYIRSLPAVRALKVVPTREVFSC